MQEQPEQKTREWYQFRYNLITASNLWKVFGTESQVNSLIYEKCKPFEEISGDGSPVSSVQSSVNAISVASHISENEYHCAICLEMYEEGESLVQLPCGHIHHETCIIRWLQEKSNCPLCNINLNMEAITFWYEVYQQNQQNGSA